jgi:hypothetical protein
VAFILGIFNLQQILDENSKENEEFGPMESLGRLIGKKTKLFVYPATEWEERGKVSDKLLSSNDIKISKTMKYLFQFLKKTNILRDITTFDINVTNIWSRKVLNMIQSGDKNWEKMVPETVSRVVKEKRLFGYVKI